MADYRRLNIMFQLRRIQFGACDFLNPWHARGTIALTYDEIILHNTHRFDLILDTHKESISSMVQAIQKKTLSPIRSEIQRIINSIVPFDSKENEHLNFTKHWLETGADLFRTTKPATPDPHLVAYFLLVDLNTNKVLLTDHKKSGLWLPTGGHVEINEHPKDTVKREIIEELEIEAIFLSHDPLFLTVTKTVGQTAGHTDVSLWYILKGFSFDTLNYDKNEFHQINWFCQAEIPYQQSDPHMNRCIKKLIHFNILKDD